MANSLSPLVSHFILAGCALEALVTLTLVSRSHQLPYKHGKYGIVQGNKTLSAFLQNFVAVYSLRVRSEAELDGMVAHPSHFTRQMVSDIQSIAIPVPPRNMSSWLNTFFAQLGMDFMLSDEAELACPNERNPDLCKASVLYKLDGALEELRGRIVSFHYTTFNSPQNQKKPVPEILSSWYSALDDSNAGAYWLVSSIALFAFMLIACLVVSLVACMSKEKEDDASLDGSASTDANAIMSMQKPCT